MLTSDFVGSVDTLLGSSPEGLLAPLWVQTEMGVAHRFQVKDVGESALAFAVLLLPSLG